MAAVRKTPATRRRQQARADGSREQILAVAMNLFAKHGYAGTSIGQLSKECGLPVGSIYWHFGSKAGLLWAVAERGAIAVFERMPRASNYDGDATERLAAMLDDMAGMLGEDSAFLRLVVMLSTIEHAEDTAARASAARVREHALEVWREALRPVFAPSGEPEGRRLADELAVVGRSVAIGGFVNSEGDRDRYRSVLRSFTDLIRARAHEHFARQPVRGARTRRAAS